MFKNCVIFQKILRPYFKQIEYLENIILVQMLHCFGAVEEGKQSHYLLTTNPGILK